MKASDMHFIIGAQYLLADGKNGLAQVLLNT